MDQRCLHRIAMRIACGICLAVLAACQTPGDRAAVAPNPHYKVGGPYEIAGRWYYPREEPGYDAIGIASWYGEEFDGRLTANGEIFDMNRLSAAHTTLPMPTLVEVENLENGRKVRVRVNDRGPFAGDRIIDLSRAAAQALGFEKQGLARVRVRYIGRADLAMRAPLPGEALRPAQAAASPAPQRAGKPDVIAQLIGEAAPAAATAAPAPSLSPPAPTQAPEIWIDIETFAALSALEEAQLALAALGPVRVLTAGGDRPEAGAYRLQIGPYFDASAAQSRLALLREAGYLSARIAPDGL